FPFFLLFNRAPAFLSAWFETSRGAKNQKKGEVIRIYRSTSKATFTTARYSTILLFSTVAEQRFNSIPVIFLTVFPAALIAFAAASSQLFVDVPISSMTFTTVASFTLDRKSTRLYSSNVN